MLNSNREEVDVSTYCINRNWLQYGLILCFFGFLLIPQKSLFAQSEDRELNYRAIRVTLLPGIGTNGLDSRQYTAKYSLNIIGGYHGGLDGYEIGLMNLNQYYTRGFQIGGINATAGDMTGVNISAIANFSRREMRGMQFSLFGNIAEGRLEGIQAGGLVNASVLSMRGIQLAGIANIAGRNMQGAQISGVINTSVEDAQGFMLAGFGNFNAGTANGIFVAGVANFARDQRGITVAGLLNMTRRLQGAQVSGLANLAYRVQGIQVGLVNFAHDFEGIPIGLISYYNNGRKNFDYWISDAGFQNFGIKLGTSRIYNMISFGYNPFLEGREVWSIGWTIGTYKPLDEARNNPRWSGYFRMKDISIQNFQEGSFNTRINTIYKYRYLVGKDITNYLGVYIGPTINLMISRESRSNEYTWYSIFSGERGGSDFAIWFGFSAGVQIFGH